VDDLNGALTTALAGHPQRPLIEQALSTLLAFATTSSDHDDWRLIDGTLKDLQAAMGVFRPHRMTRKVTVFGSARSAPGSEIYQLAESLAEAVIQAGFEVMTGAGGGVMEAANRGAGGDRSFGLNVLLPFEQDANPFISEHQSRLLQFRYFFTRKLFFLRESDALVVLPGGFGTLDELFESLTLIQTGRSSPIPLVLLAPQGDPFWDGWQQALRCDLQDRGLIGEHDLELLSTAHSAAEAVALIRRFYRVFHRLQPVQIPQPDPTGQPDQAGQRDQTVMELLLHLPLPEQQLALINQGFPDLLRSGLFVAAESCDEAGAIYPCLRFDFNQRRVGRLYQLIDHLNALDLAHSVVLQHPEQRLCPLAP